MFGVQSPYRCSQTLSSTPNKAMLIQWAAAREMIEEERVDLRMLSKCKICCCCSCCCYFLSKCLRILRQSMSTTNMLVAVPLSSCRLNCCFRSSCCCRLFWFAFYASYEDDYQRNEKQRKSRREIYYCSRLFELTKTSWTS